MESYMNKLPYYVNNTEVVAPSAGISTHNVNGGIVKQLVDLNATRKSIWLSHKGQSYPVYLGVDNTTTAGSTMNNFVALSVGSNFELKHYSGAIWGIHNGASGTYEQIGVCDIG